MEVSGRPSYAVRLWFLVYGLSGRLAGGGL